MLFIMCCGWLSNILVFVPNNRANLWHYKSGIVIEAGPFQFVSEQIGESVETLISCAYLYFYSNH